MGLGDLQPCGAHERVRLVWDRGTGAPLLRQQRRGPMRRHGRTGETSQAGPLCQATTGDAWASPAARSRQHRVRVLCIVILHSASLGLWSVSPSACAENCY